MNKKNEGYAKVRRQELDNYPLSATNRVSFRVVIPLLRNGAQWGEGRRNK